MVELSGFFFDNTGTAVSGVAVSVFPRNTVSCATTTTTTDANGFWTRSAIAEGRYDVQFTCGSAVSRIKYDDEVQLLELETATLKIRNPADTFVYDVVPAAITANRTLNLPLTTGTQTLVATGTAIADCSTILLGTGGDASFTYDGTNAVIDTAVVGTGLLVIKGSSSNTIAGDSSVGDLDIQANVAVTDATARDIGLLVLNAACDVFVNVLTIKANCATPNAYIGSGLFLDIGDAGAIARSCTQGTNQVRFFNGTAPVGTLAGGSSLYTKDVACSSELHVLDEAGNETLLSPHDMATGEWVFDSRNSVTGAGIHVRMEEMMKRLCDEFGWGLVTEYPAKDC